MYLVLAKYAEAVTGTLIASFVVQALCLFGIAIEETHRWTSTGSGSWRE